MGDVRATQFSKVLKSTSLKQKQNPNSYNERAKKMEYYLAIKRNEGRTSLVTQWLRIRLPMQGTRVQGLVREGPTCHRATKPLRHNY